MIICFHNLNLDTPTIHTKFGGMYKSFFDALRESGTEVVYSDNLPLPKADILVVPIGGSQTYSSLLAISRFPGPVILYAPPAMTWFNSRLLRSIRDKVIFAYGPDASSFSLEKYGELRMPYYYLPFGSDPDVMRPLGLEKIYDIVFVGSLEHATRRAHFFQALIDLIGTKSIMCVGTGWQEYGIPSQLIAWGQALNVFYNLGKVCINVHASEQVRGMNRQEDLNNRVFDLAMAGCCQVCDNSAAVRLCFNDNEIALADEPQAWAERVIFLLKHRSEAEKYRENACRRARLEHTWQHRSKEFLGFLEPWYESTRAFPSPGLAPFILELYSRYENKVRNRARKLLAYL